MTLRDDARLALVVAEGQDESGFVLISGLLRRLAAGVLEHVPPDDVRSCVGPGCDEVLAGRADQRYCSPACRSRAHRNGYATDRA